jgi:hypothetical protein
MTWVRVDDQLHAHPKIRHAWRNEPAAVGLHLLALSYASAYLTDGLIDTEFVRDQIPSRARRDRAVAALEDAGLWERNGGGWTIHDYLDFNDSRERIQARRRADAARKRSTR